MIDPHPTSSLSREVRNRVVIQRNPTSGTGRGARQIHVMVRELKALGYRLRLFADRQRLDDFLAHPEIRTEVRCLVAAGGDGTIASLINRHADLPIATLPLGTENLVARYLKIPRCGRTVARMVHQHHTRRFDTAFIDEQRFLVMASCGVDAEVVRQLTFTRTGNISHLSYVRPILLSFLRYRFPEISVCGQDGKLLARGSHVIVTNIPEYGFHMPFCPNADPHDGLLDVRVFRTAGMFATAVHAVRTRLGRADRTSDVLRFTTTEVTLTSENTSVAVQCDGDPAPCCPVTIRVEPDSMQLVVPEPR
ncbi:MAG: diacylglycerol kinase family protein [Fuerstiella sp.]